MKQVKTILTAGLLTVLLIPAAALPSPRSADREGPAAKVSSAKCPHVRILGVNDKDEIFHLYRDSIVPPRENQKKVLAAALDALPPFVCKAVQKVVFLNTVNGDAIAWVSKAFPDLINISVVPNHASETRLELSDDLEREQVDENGDIDPERTELARGNAAAAWPEAIHAIVHEAFHSAAHLLESATDDYDGPRVWPSDAVAMAKETAEKAKLTGGFKVEWARVSREFIDKGMAAGFSQGRKGYRSEPPDGYMTEYAGKEPGEELAETAAWPTVIPFLSARYSGITPNTSDWKNGCSELQATSGTGIPSKVAALYTKISFLKDIEFITEKAFDDCVGNGTVGLKKDGLPDGFAFYDYETWRPYTAYKSDPKLGRKTFSSVLSAKGDLKSGGKTYPATIELEFFIGEDELPRGIYEITGCNIVSVRAPIIGSDVMFWRKVEGKGNQTICGRKGFVLVTRSTTEKIEGAVVLQQAWKMSVPPVPEVAGFPVHVIFAFEK